MKWWSTVQWSYRLLQLWNWISIIKFDMFESKWWHEKSGCLLWCVMLWIQFAFAQWKRQYVIIHFMQENHSSTVLSKYYWKMFHKINSKGFQRVQVARDLTYSLTWHHITYIKMRCVIMSIWMAGLHLFC